MAENVQKKPEIKFTIEHKTNLETMKIKDLKGVSIPIQFDPDLDINSVQNYGQTLLLWSIVMQKRDLFKALVETSKEKNGCNLNFIGGLNKTPLNFAVENISNIGLEFTKMLILAGASLQVISPWFPSGGNGVNKIPSTLLDIVLEDNPRLKKLMDGISSESLEAALGFLSPNIKFVFETILCQCEPFIADRHLRSEELSMPEEAFIYNESDIQDITKYSARKREAEFWDNVIELGKLCLEESARRAATHDTNSNTNTNINADFISQAPLIQPLFLGTTTYDSSIYITESQNETIKQLQNLISGQNAALDQLNIKLKNLNEEQKTKIEKLQQVKKEQINKLQMDNEAQKKTIESQNEMLTALQGVIAKQKGELVLLRDKVVNLNQEQDLLANEKNRSRPSINTI